MLLQNRPAPAVLNPLRELAALQESLSNFLTGEAVEFPPVNMWSSDSGAIIRAQIPGVAPDDIDISITNDTLILRGFRHSDAMAEEKHCHRRERSFGQFTRAIKLPFSVEAENVEANFAAGILQIKLPRAEKDKPRKITVNFD